MEIGKELAQELITLLKSTKDFVVEQAPDIARQILAWELYTSMVWAAICVLAIVLCVFSMCNSDDEGVIGGGFFVTLVSLICFGIQISDIIKVKVAPKIFLLDYLMGIVKLPFDPNLN
jgi:hypothetical protein